MPVIFLKIFKIYKNSPVEKFDNNLFYLNKFNHQEIIQFKYKSYFLAIFQILQIVQIPNLIFWPIRKEE